MGKRESLSDLLQMVEAGGEIFMPDRGVFGLGSHRRLRLAISAHLGSLDAAMALHDSLMIGHDWLVRLDEDHGGFANVTTQDFAWHQEYDGTEAIKNVIDLGASYSSYAATPARAWLISLLKALIAQEAGA